MGLFSRRSSDLNSPQIDILSGNELYREALAGVLVGEGLSVHVKTPDPLQIVPREGGRTILLIDSQTGDVDVDLILDLRRRVPATSVVVLVDRFLSEGVKAAFRAGADGYLVKSLACGALAASLRLIAAGETIPPTALVDALLSNPEPVAAGPAEDVDAHLTARELEIAGYLTEGLADKAIARRMYLADATVKVHVKALLRKIGASNRTQAALWALRKGISASKIAGVAIGTSIAVEVSGTSLSAVVDASGTMPVL